jgi:hypothetical protein
MLTVRGSAAIVTVAEAVALAGGLASVTTTEIDFEPLTLYTVEKLAPVAVAGEPPVAVHVNT